MLKQNSSSSEAQESLSGSSAPSRTDSQSPLSTSSTEEERARRIAEAAYFRAQKRGFEPGREEEDWLEAEIQLAESHKD